MKITQVEADCYRVPVRLPMIETDNYQTVVIVEIQTDEGVVGHGLAGAPGMPIPTRDFVNQQAGDRILGLDPLDPEVVYAALMETFNSRALGGVWDMGVSAIDVALWDIRGRYTGLPVSRMLGGAHTHVPMYVTFGLAQYDDDQLVGAASTQVAAGHRALKMVVGVDRGRPSCDGPCPATPTSRAAIQRDAVRVEKVRNAIGPDIGLMLDANCRYSIDEAKLLARLVEPFDITWLEEPLRRNNVRLSAELRQQTTVPVAAGQHVGGVWGHTRMIAGGAVDIPQPNVCHVGGYTQGIKVAHVAEAYDLSIGHGGRWPYHNLHLHGAVPNGGLVEFHLASWQAMDLLFSGTPRCGDGYAEVPTGDGVGFDPRPDALERYRVPRDQHLAGGR